MQRPVILVFVIFLVAACSSPRQVTSEKKDTAKTDKGQYDESFDPNSLNDDDIVISKKETVTPEQPTHATPPKKSDDNNEQPQMREANGYRVQILATKNYISASMEKEKAQDVFGSMNYKTYFVFEQPFYKVRVGDVLTKEAAEEILEMARDYGYHDALVVRSKVNIPVESGDN